MDINAIIKTVILEAIEDTLSTVTALTVQYNALVDKHNNVVEQLAELTRRHEALGAAVNDAIIRSDSERPNSVGGMAPEDFSREVLNVITNASECEDTRWFEAVQNVRGIAPPDYESEEFRAATIGVITDALENEHDPLCNAVISVIEQRMQDGGSDLCEAVIEAVRQEVSDTSSSLYDEIDGIVSNALDGGPAIERAVDQLFRNSNIIEDRVRDALEEGGSVNDTVRDVIKTMAEEGQLTVSISVSH